MSSGSEYEMQEENEDEIESELQHDIIDSQDNELDHSDFQQEKQDENKKLEIHQNENDKHCATYVYLDEDHTLGNALRYVLINRSDVDFCGYSLPHPSENKMNLRLQTVEDTSTDIVMNEGLESLVQICNCLQNKFVQAVEDFDQQGKQKKRKNK